MFFVTAGMFGSPLAAMGLAGLTAAAAGQYGLPGLGLPGLGFPYAAPAGAAMNPAAVAGVRMVGGGGGGMGSGCVLLVSNLHETETEPDHLFVLFGVYGDVQVCRKDESAIC